MKAATFLALFKNNVSNFQLSSNGQARGNCPFHDDKNPSFSVNVDEGLWRCMAASCGQEGNAWQFAERLGIDLGNTKRRIVDEYDYVDEEGHLLYQVVRYEPKGFAFRRPDGKGGWIYNAQGVRRILYRLPKTKTCFVVEGEKDVDRLRKIGLLATTNPGGAGRWTDDFTQQMVDAGIRRVVLIPDNQEQGRTHMQAVARSLLSAGLRVKILELPELPDKGDVTDWLDADHTRDELVSLATEAPWIASEDLAPDDFGLIVDCLEDVEEKPLKHLWRFPLGKVSALLGDKGNGKSYCMLHIAAIRSQGGEWPNKEGSAEQGSTILITVEDDPADTIKPRFRCMGGNVKYLHVVSGSYDQQGRQRLFKLTPDDLEKLERLVKSTKARLVIVDPMGTVMGRKVDTNNLYDTSDVLAQLAAFASRMDVAVVVIMHLTKAVQLNALYRAQGSVGFVTVARCVYAIAPDSSDPDLKLFLHVATNVSKRMSTLAFRLIEVPENPVAVLRWEKDYVGDADVNELLGPAGFRDSEKQKMRESVQDWVRELFEEGLPIKSVDIENEAKANHIPWNQLWTAKASLKIAAKKHGKEGWYWHPPPDLKEKAQADDEPGVAPEAEDEIEE